ncbi:ABC transporter permease [Dysgonomonas mossii]|uniref:ABC transporter permease n=1 Tax=Dysgonomonas mossii TaxID=163665 RepID=UPI00399631CD
MIKQIFKIIWSERKINVWILFELVLVFCILWFCVDYIYFFTKRYLEPTGYNVEHVYNINMGIKEEGHVLINNGTDAQKDSLVNIVWTIVDRIKKYPDIEYISLSSAAVPYSGSFMSNKASLDTMVDYIQFKSVSPDYFNVFKINLQQGQVESWSSTDNIVISGNKDNQFLKHDTKQIKSLVTGDNENKQVIGVAASSKRSEFDEHNPIVYTLLSTNDRETVYFDGIEICVRVKAEADKNFIERFTKDMQEQIAMDPYFLSSVTSISDLRKEFMKWNKYDNNFKSIFSISSFLFINIFLAVVGTFWFRIQTRRNEIGLRVAVGSTRMNIKALFILETLILLLLASLIATPICINIALADILRDIGVPSIDRGEEPIQISQYVINYLFTAFILITISISAVLYPSWRASRIQPAEALRDE